MFKIADGREYFYQWDLDRQVIVEDSSIVEVHFCNRTDECSLVVDVVNGLANVPNIILTNSFDIRVFGYDGKATRYDEVFKVKSRTKPADYVYVETEARKFDELMTKAEEAITLANEITEYVENNKLDFVDDGEGNVELKAINPEGGGEGGNVDLTGYATEEYVDEAIKNIEIPEVDLTGYATEKFVEDAIAAIEIPESETVDLTGYATEDWVKNQGYLTEHQNLDEYAKKTEIPDISGKADKIHSHPEYLTEHQSLADYAKKSEIPTNYLTSIPAEYITESELNDKGYLTEHQSLDGYATEKYVDDAIANIDIPEGGGGSSGGGVKIIRIPSNSNSIKNNPELVASLWQFLNDYYANGSVTIPEDTIFYIQSLEMLSRWITVGSINGNISQYGTYLLLCGFDPTDEKTTHIYSIYFNSDGSFQRLQTSYAPVVSSSGGSSWTRAADQYDSGLYNAKEIFILCQDTNTGRYCSSKIVMDESSILGYNTYREYCFTTPDGSDNNTPYWYYDGGAIQVYFSGDYSLNYILYKT